jgi:hypothetical protein
MEPIGSVKMDKWRKLKGELEKRMIALKPTNLFRAVQQNEITLILLIMRRLEKEEMNQ